jgi:SprT protein
MNGLRLSKTGEANGPKFVGGSLTARDQGVAALSSMLLPGQVREPTVPQARVARLANIWNIPGLQERVSIQFSRRMRRSLGRCIPRRRSVRLNPWVLQRNPELMEEVLCHELAHIAAFELHGAKVRPHGREWRALMRAAGFGPRIRARLSRDVQAEPNGQWPAEPLYEHRCPVCQITRLARRRVPQWRCAACASAGLEAKLVITKRSWRIA